MKISYSSKLYNIKTSLPQTLIFGSGNEHNHDTISIPRQDFFSESVTCTEAKPNESLLAEAAKSLSLNTHLDLADMRYAECI